MLRNIWKPLAWTEAANVDPNYGLVIRGGELTDHHHAVLLNEREVRQIRRAKVEHPFMGRMAFPDGLDHPPNGGGHSVGAGNPSHW